MQIPWGLHPTRDLTFRLESNCEPADQKNHQHQANQAAT